MSRLPSEDDLRSLAGMERLMQHHSEEIRLLREQAGDSALALRVSTLERTLAEHSKLLALLRQKAIDSDTYMQRLIAAVEKLCPPQNSQPEASVDEISKASKADSPEPDPQPAVPTAEDLPFQACLKDAIERMTEFQPRIVPALNKPRSVD
jgi:hypothetical protein